MGKYLLYTNSYHKIKVKCTDILKHIRFVYKLFKLICSGFDSCAAALHAP